ncbi:MAG: DUF2357 domain-containing protein [Chitinophagales bacterium]
MAVNKLVIPVYTSFEKIELILYGENSGETIIVKEDAAENGEAQFQIKEGHFYEYKISEGYSICTSEIVSQSNINKSSGRIAPNIYVGTLSIDVLKTATQEKCGEVKLEVQSVKTSYREDYRYMLEEITEKCTDLLLQHSSPVSQKLEVDFNADAATLYQRFAFIKSILDSTEFNDAVHKVLTSPVTRWRETEIIKDIRSVRRFHSSTIRQIATTTNRIDLPSEHPLKTIVHSIPAKINASHKTETVDTPENRFVKHALVSFQSFCSDFKTKVRNSERVKQEAALLEDKLEQQLNHSVFKEISTPTTLPLNSPVLQRKEGYREILRVWLMFDLAAKIIWKGGDDVYSGNKKDVAVLYEYWLFFKLLDILKDIFKIDSRNISDLIVKTDNNLEMQLKQGKHFPVQGIYEGGSRKLNILFSYNRAFTGKKEYPHAGSWTKNMRPDYTLSIWPYGIEQSEAEIEELIVHVHFDAKYKVKNMDDIFGTTENISQTEEEIQKELSDEKEELRKGTYKREDLLKMHAYKDAIRRTGGAYILYPGTDKRYTSTGFHEIIPGLGAFSIRPSKTNSGTEELKAFLLEVVQHFMIRTSQREKIAFRAYDIYKNPPNTENIIKEPIPENYGANRDLIPDETNILVGYYNSPEQYEWIKRSGLYNFRMGSGKGSLILDKETVGSKYLLLHTVGEISSGELWKIISSGPKVYSKDDMSRKGYPKSNDEMQEYYLVIEIEKVAEPEFENAKWNFKKLKNYKKGIASAFPFITTLAELMKNKTTF